MTVLILLALTVTAVLATLSLAGFLGDLPEASELDGFDA